MLSIIIKKGKKEIETLSSSLNATDAQEIFYDIIFKKKVEEGLKDADNGNVYDWNAFKKQMKGWYK